MPESMHCRTCFEIIDLKVKKSYELKDKVKNYKMNLGQILSDCTGLYLENDLVEKRIICVSCKQSLISFYMFRQKVFDTDQKFNELKDQNGEELPVVVKLEELEMEVNAWQSEYKVENNSTVFNEGSNKIPIKRYRHLEPSRKENLKKYKRNGDGLFECPKDNCPGLFKKLGRLEIHLENMHSENDQKTFSCESCGEEFSTLLLNKRHYLKVHAPRPYICDICENDYPSFDSLRVHMSSHVKGKRVEPRCACTLCGKLFSNEANMLRHRKTVHFANKEFIEKPYICSVCDSRWATKSKLVAHMRYHESPTYTCHICSKSFIAKGTLDKHMRCVHTDDRPFFCDNCGKKYKTKQQLRNHQTSHSDERPFKCSKCPASFKIKSGLQEHETKTHTSIRSISCDVCGNLFKTKSSLRVHMIGHNGEDIKCPHCDTTYKDKCTLRFHVRTIHLGFKKRHDCSICLINLSSRKQIVNHIEAIHKNVLTATGKTALELVRRYWTTDPRGKNLGEGPPVVIFKKQQ